MTDHAETAEAEPTEPEVRARPRARERGKMRRRLRRQREVRDGLLLDLGALVFELHAQGRREPELLQAKANELTVVDEEIRALAQALDEDIALVSLVAAGVSVTCDECGTLLTPDTRFCPNCGHAAAPGLVAVARGEEPEAAAEPEPVAEAEPIAEAEPEQVAEPEPEPIDEAEPEPEPEPVEEAEPEPDDEPDTQSTAEHETAPWLEPIDDPTPRDRADAPEPESEPEEPRRVRREQGSVERFLRGRKRS